MLDTPLLCELRCETLSLGQTPPSGYQWRRGDLPKEFRTDSVTGPYQVVAAVARTLNANKTHPALFYPEPLKENRTA